MVYDIRMIRGGGEGGREGYILCSLELCPILRNVSKKEGKSAEYRNIKISVRVKVSILVKTKVCCNIICYFVHY